MRLFEMKEHAAVAINFETELASLSMIGAQTGTAIGTDFQTQPSTDVTIPVMNNLDSAISLSHKAIPISSQTREHETISPSMTAFLFIEDPIEDGRMENEAKVVPFRETSLHRPLSMNSSALDPSYFSSKR